MNMKIFKVIVKIVFYFSTFLLYSLWLTVFQELAKDQIRVGNVRFSILLRFVMLVPLFMSCWFIAKRVTRRKRNAKK